MDTNTDLLYAMEDCIVSELGEALALQAIIKAMSYYDQEEIFTYIIRCYDLPLGKYCSEDDEEI